MNLLICFILGVVLPVLLVGQVDNDSLIQQASDLLKTNRVDTRRKALEISRSLFTTDPSNLAYAHLVVRSAYESGHYPLAVRTLEDLFREQRAIATHSDSVEYSNLLFYWALIHERSALKYTRMISEVFTSNHSDEPIAVPLNHFGVESQIEAKKGYFQALQYDPRNQEAAFRLAALHYEESDYERMIAILQRVTAQFPRHKDALLFLGLAHSKQGSDRRAAEYYDLAFTQMDEKEISEFLYIGYLVPKSDRKEYESGRQSPLRAKQYEDKLWRTKDPLYLTEINERKIEHYNRMAYVNLRFGLPAANIPGWGTDRGRTYLQYGPPARLIRYQPDEVNLGGKERWEYPTAAFIFEDQFASGKFSLHKVNADRSSLLDKEDFFPTVKRLPLRTRQFCFRTPDKRTKVASYYELRDTVGITSSSGEVGLFLLDEESRITNEARQLYGRTVRTTAQNRTIGEAQVVLEPTQRVHSLSHEILFADVGWHAVERKKFKTRIFDPSRLEISDVIVGAMQVDGRVPLPSFDLRFAGNQAIGLYFEIYNLRADDEGRRKYQIDVAATPIRSDGFLGKFKSLLRSDRHATSTSFEGQTRESSETYTLGIDISSLRPGTHQIRVRVTDQLSGELVERTEQITVTQ